MTAQLLMFAAPDYRARRDDGIRRARAHAEEVVCDWTATALQHLRAWAPGRAAFLAEDFRDAMAGVLPEPPDGRAWGAVFQQAAREHVVRRAGYAPAKSSNGSPKCQWVAA